MVGGASKNHQLTPLSKIACLYQQGVPMILHTTPSHPPPPGASH